MNEEVQGSQKVPRNFKCGDIVKYHRTSSRQLSHIKLQGLIYNLYRKALLGESPDEGIIPIPVSYTHLTLPTTPYV